MRSMGLFTGADLKKLSEDDLVKSFGKSGRFYYRIVRGIDEREVQPHRETKSVSAEDTFPYDLTTLEEMAAELDKIALSVFNRVERSGLKGRTVTLKVKYADFKQITRNKSVVSAIGDLESIAAMAKELMANCFAEGQRVRLLGIGLSNFGELIKEPKQSDQLSLF
jgi:DNA polymerase-4